MSSAATDDCRHLRRRFRDWPTAWRARSRGDHHRARLPLRPSSPGRCRTVAGGRRCRRSPGDRSRAGDRGWRVCSSTAIRLALADGMIEHANALLGHSYELEGVVRPGDQRGRTIGPPTATSIRSANPVLPGTGVYAVDAGLQRGGRLVWRPRWPISAGARRLTAVRCCWRCTSSKAAATCTASASRVLESPALYAASASLLRHSTSSRRRSPATVSRPAQSRIARSSGSSSLPHEHRLSRRGLPAAHRGFPMKARCSRK